MIVGILLKNYKIYSGVKYIPVTTNHNFIAYIGDNGVGKSSILEALDTYFNDKEWNLTKGASTTDANIPYITIMHLIDKNIAKALNDNTELLEKIEKISECMWNFDSVESQLGSKSVEAKSMLGDLRKLNKTYKDTHYLIISGRGYWNTIHAHFGSFDSIIANLFGIQGFDSQKESSNERLRKELSGINSFIKGYYSYIYMPVEAGIEEFTKLETNNMQKLIGTDINEKIKEIITDKTLSGINIKLNNFIGELETKLNNYTYKHSNRTNISMNELTQKVIELFFSIRTLHKNVKDGGKISADKLSSGEKRQAFIEVSAGLLKSQEIKNKEIIFALDEPEASLSISNNFSQFEKIINLQGSNMQILITTHWYGFLPIALNGNTHLLSKEIDGDKVKFNFNTFDLYNYRERLRQMVKNQKSENNEIPSDIQLKSVYDLVQSIVSSVRLDEPYNWLICEGSSEKIYFDFYFKDLIENNNLRILPVGGASEVIKIYDYLRLPMSEKEHLKGKIYCLIDSDGQSVNFQCDNTLKNMVAKRLFNKKQEFKTILLNIDDNNHETKTEIEDCLDGEIFIDTLKQFNNDAINKIIFEEGNIKDLKLNSNFCLDLKDSQKETIKDFFDENNGYRKIEFAKRYVEFATSKTEMIEPKWISEIKKWFNNQR
ncbi:AAA family ATPase [Campylobacter sp. 9BO]|uniref:AAA family ATPase n=1 Tax=Campylobacter sp. 9BO TaxID=3424759 RepID=UPI003D325B66